MTPTLWLQISPEQPVRWHLDCLTASEAARLADWLREPGSENLLETRLKVGAEIVVSVGAALATLQAQLRGAGPADLLPRKP